MASKTSNDVSIVLGSEAKACLRSNHGGRTRGVTPRSTARLACARERHKRGTRPTRTLRFPCSGNNAGFDMPRASKAAGVRQRRSGFARHSFPATRQNLRRFRTSRPVPPSREAARVAESRTYRVVSSRPEQNASIHREGSCRTQDFRPPCTRRYLSVATRSGPLSLSLSHTHTQRRLRQAVLVGPATRPPCTPWPPWPGPPPCTRPSRR